MISERKKVVLIKPELKFSLTTLTEFLNENFEKCPAHRTEVSKNFSVSDVQGYIRRGSLPLYLKEGTQINIIKIEDENIPKSKLYSLQETEIEK